jgi:hypothetical protein
VRTWIEGAAEEVSVTGGGRGGGEGGSVAGYLLVLAGRNSHHVESKDGGQDGSCERSEQSSALQ